MPNKATDMMVMCMYLSILVCLFNLARLYPAQYPKKSGRKNLIREGITIMFSLSRGYGYGFTFQKKYFSGTNHRVC